MFRNLPRYRDQRSTNMPWCPAVPAHWALARNKEVMVAKAETVGARSADHDLLSLTKMGVIFRDITTGKGKIPASFDTYQIIDKGDLIMCLFDVDETPRTVGLARQRGMITGAYDRFVVRDGVLAEYVNWFYLSVDNVKGLRPLYRGLRKTIPLDRFMASQFPLPPVEEQAEIAKYLAHANVRIGEAIAAKRHLIALVEEQKRSLLNERMLSVPSGDLVPVKALLRPVSSVVGDSHRQKTLLSLTLRGVVPRDLENAKGKFPSDFSTYQDVRPGQFVFCLFDVDETPRTVGLSRVEGMITGAYDVFDSVDPSASEYLELFFTAMDNVKGYRPLYTGLRKVLPTDRFLRTVVPFPSDDVRQSVVGEIRASMAESTAVIERVSREIALLQEFRTRLVADVVTGQVDVRAIAASLPDTLEQDTQLDALLDDDLADVLGEGEE